MFSGVKFSIVIPAFNEEKILSDCIGCIRKQIGGFDCEIIVVNNNSTDHTADVARDLGVVVINENKRGVGWARKAGTSVASGELVLQIDADTHLPIDYLEQVYRRFQFDPTLVCVGGQMVYYDAPAWKNVLRIFVHYYLWIWARVFSLGKIGPMGNNMTFKKSVYDKTDGFSGNLKFGEDADVCRKMSKYGKIKLDMTLKCLVSVRRFKFNRYLVVYFINFLRMCIGRPPIKNDLPHPDEI